MTSTLHLPIMPISYEVNMLASFLHSDELSLNDSQKKLIGDKLLKIHDNIHILNLQRNELVDKLHELANCVRRDSVQQA
jgi:hypothetical protein